MKKSHYMLLVLIFLATLSIRMYFAFSTPNYSSDEAYFTYRQIEYIQETSKPLFYDELSFSGRSLLFPPLFGYSLAFLGIMFPLNFAMKFFPNLFASFIVFFAYIIARRISRDSGVALLTAFVVASIPIYFRDTINTISVYSLVIPLFFLLLYSFMNIREKKWTYIYVGVIVLLTLVHPSVILFIMGLWIYLLLVKAEGLKIDKAEMEIIIFSTFFVVLMLFILFKKVFLFHGPSVIWQNIPRDLLSLHFSEVSMVGAVYFIGIIPFFSALYIIYRYMFKEKRKDIYLLIGFILSVGLLLWLRLIEFTTGLMFLGVIMSLLFAQFWKLIVSYLKNTKAARFSWVFGVIVVGLFTFTSLMPAFSLAENKIETSVSDTEIEAFKWIRNNTESDAVILATVGEGHLVTAIGRRKNIIDPNFLFIKDSEQRYEDISKIYTTFSTTEAVRLMNKYDADYIYFSEKAKFHYRIDELTYIDNKCFSEVYDNAGIKIYNSKCRMGELN